MKDFTMVIPSYWGSAEKVGEETGEIVFDHPTTLDDEGTLGRLLESLDIFGEFSGTVVIISVANEQQITDKVEAKVESIIKPFRDRFAISHFRQRTLEKIKQSLAEKGVSETALQLLNLDNYAAVRNMCSLAGILNGSRHTIFIDDDEVFTDPDFLNKVEQSMSCNVAGKKIEALAGYYLQPDTYRLDDTKVPQWRAPHWNNTASMNKAFDMIIGRGDRLKPTPFVFGGNMTLSLDAIKQVPFDPRITRGEDIDFLLNLRIQGITFYLDRELSIKHLPPGSAQPAWKKFREDVLRFLYERKKVTDHTALKLSEFQPYPGEFLDDDLEDRIEKTCELLKQEYQSQSDQQGAQECDKIITLLKEKSWEKMDTKTWLQEITNHWQELTAEAIGMGIPE